jgi:hypothetical protein
MSLPHQVIARLATLTFVLCVCLAAVEAQELRGEVRGQIKDEFGGAIVGAVVNLKGPDLKVKSTQTDSQGYYAFVGFRAGRYELTAGALGFAAYEDDEVQVSAGKSLPLNLTLAVAPIAVEVKVGDPTSTLDVDPEKDPGALILKGAELEALPDDPDELATTLQVMSGAAGSAEFYLDGFRTANLPSKQNIREIRISQNPFAAEFDRLGTNRIEIFTKPGTEKLHGQTFLTFSDESLNSRNPFAATRAPFQSRLLSGSLSGPLLKRNSSFFLDFERREIDDNSVISANILDPSLEIISFNNSVLTPQRRTSFSFRLDQKLNPNNTLIARYSYFGVNEHNSGVGGFSLASVGFNTSQTVQRFQLTETAVLGKRLVNETRFLFVRQRNSQLGDNSEPTIDVLDAFTDRGSVVGQSSRSESRWELQNYLFWTRSTHNLKAGLQLRGVSLNDISNRNFGGTFTFAGGNGVKLDQNGQVVYAEGQPVFVPLTSIERYRRTLLFQRDGLPANAGSLSPDDLGFGPSQFTITTGTPEADVTRRSFAAFVQDDWRVHPNFTLSAGVRYEVQSRVHNSLNLAPRLRFAWAPGSAPDGRRSTVIRGGAGVFYSQLDEDLMLQAIRFNGINQQLHIITEQIALQSFPRLPVFANTANSIAPQTIIRLADDARQPYTFQTAIGIDRQLPHNITISATYLYGRGLHLLRSRNINAPLPGTFTPGQPETAVRPLGGLNNIFLYETSGRSNQQQLVVRFNTRFNPRLTLFGTYILGEAKSDTDGPATFPANSYDLSTEYGRSLLDVRHLLFVGGTIKLRWGLQLNPLIMASSGYPFNIITGRDTNGDTLFTDRPAFATDLNKPDIIITRFGAFDPKPTLGQPLISRNFGTGPALFTVNLRLSKTIEFGRGSSATQPTATQKTEAGDFGDGATGGVGVARSNAREKRYRLNLSLQVQNLFNRVNAATPVGNLSSLLFGQSISLDRSFGIGGGPGAGNRRIYAQIGFSF